GGGGGAGAGEPAAEHGHCEPCRGAAYPSRPKSHALTLLQVLERPAQCPPVPPPVQQRARVEEGPDRPRYPARAAQIPAELRVELPRLADHLARRLAREEHRLRRQRGEYGDRPGRLAEVLAGVLGRLDRGQRPGYRDPTLDEPVGGVAPG